MNSPSELEKAKEMREKRQPNDLTFWRRVALAGACVSLASVAISLLAVVQTWRANAHARIADSRRLVALSESERDTRFDRSLLLAVEALSIEKTPEARNNLLAALLHRPELEMFLHTSEGEVSGLAFSPDGKTLAVGYYRSVANDNGVILFDAISRQRLQVAPLPDIAGYVTSMVFSPDGKTLAAGYTMGGVVLFDTTSRQWLQTAPLPVTEGGAWGVAFSPDGKTLAAGYSRGAYVAGGGVVLFDITNRQRPQAAPLTVPEGGVSGIASDLLICEHNRLRVVSVIRLRG
jgi:WD40 repeat protein